VNCQSSTILTTANHYGVVKHNELRAKHGVPNLVLDASIISIAQQYAEYLAANQYFQHSSDAMTGKYGENLYYTCSYPSAPDAASNDKIKY
jgi:glioma pathogenesis-related protein 2